MKFKVKAMKTPMNAGAPAMAPMKYECTEFKVAPALMLVEAVARGLPQVAPADYDRMKMRLLKSPDIQYLTEQVFMNYSVESDKLKLLLTILTHCANEILTEATQQQKKKEIAMLGRMDGQAHPSGPNSNLTPEQPKKEDPPVLTSLEAPERMEPPGA
ncbi:MAG: hypothetical protein GY845_30585 [Planctomycetes bacterium]|nr:hypothetical protein [Planctomycetota bacterium]